MAGMSFEDSIRQIVKNKLDPYTNDVIKKRADAEAKYFGDPNATYNEFSDVNDPNVRRALVEQRRQGLQSEVTSYNDIVDNRNVGIDNIVNAFAKAKAEEDATAKDQWSMKMDLENLALQKAAGARAGANDAKSNQTVGDMINQLIAAGYSPEQAKTIAASAMAGGAVSDWSGYLTPPKVTTAKTGNSGGGLFSSPVVKSIAGGLAGRWAGARAGAMLGGGVGGPWGAAIGTGVGAISPSVFTYLRSKLSK